MAPTLSRAGNHDLLASRKESDLCLFPIEKLLLVGGRGDDRRRVALLHRNGYRSQLRGHPWTVGSGFCDVLAAGFPAASSPQGHSSAETLAGGSKRCGKVSQSPVDSPTCDQLGSH